VEGDNTQNGDGAQPVDIPAVGRVHGKKCYTRGAAITIGGAVIFAQLRAGGCQSYLVGCAESCAAVLIDPEMSLIDRYQALAARDGLRIRHLVDTHTHADHFSATREVARRLEVPISMHRLSPAPFVDLRLDDGEMLVVGNLRLQVLHTPGHTQDSMCLRVEDRVFTGDTLLIGATGRTDLPTGNPEALYDSLFNRLLRLDSELKVHPAHEYKGRDHSTIGQELSNNPRLQVRERGAFVEMMNNLNLSMPTHLTEALRTNMSGGKTVAQMLAEAAATVPFMSLAELKARTDAGSDELILLDVREREAYEAGHIPGAKLLPRGQLELRVNQELPDPLRRIVACCEFGRISTLATATLREMGYLRAVALDGGVKAWREAGYPLVPGSA
jgi:glyoxylase-like metal-dependent hydrolase (beta-lactamase superfamily II)/rhodanese-related sulfurtransferase